MQQAYRNTEVREIANVLASLEPGASSSSKLRLAMQFEDTVFKSASSLEDYRKKLTKRLKKVQKTYVPPAAPNSTSTKLAILHQLKQQFGEDIRYILKHATAAIEAMRSRHGEEKAAQLKQHTDGIKMWAADLGLLDNNNNYSNNGEPNVNLSDEQLAKLQIHLEKKRMENIMAHVVKLADPDRFLLNTMVKSELSMTESKRASKLIAVNTRKRYGQFLQLTEEIDPNVVFQKALEQIQLPVPPPTRNQRNDQQAALVHLERTRNATTLLLGWAMVPEKSTLPRNITSKAHATTKEGIAFISAAIKEQRRILGGEPEVSLEDAWMKPLVLTQEVDLAASTAAKRNKTDFNRPIIRSSVLLTPGRKTPSNLLPALKRKRAILVRPEPQGEGSHMILVFGQAFVMTIYFVPLLVTLRCYSEEDAHSKDQRAQLHRAVSTSLDHGLSQLPQLSVWGVKGDVGAVGHVVQERLRDASAHATHVLRKCFENLAKENMAEFEVEIREATALLEFINLARTTYIPDWQDDDS